MLDVVAELLFSHGVYRCALDDGCLQVDFAPTSARTEFYNLAYSRNALRSETMLDSDREEIRQSQVRAS
mgnify:CR=1 FL=1